MPWWLKKKVSQSQIWGNNKSRGVNKYIRKWKAKDKVIISLISVERYVMRWRRYMNTFNSCNAFHTIESIRFWYETKYIKHWTLSIQCWRSGENNSKGKNRRFRVDVPKHVPFKSQKFCLLFSSFDIIRLWANKFLPCFLLRNSFECCPMKPITHSLFPTYMLPFSFPTEHFDWSIGLLCQGLKVPLKTHSTGFHWNLDLEWSQQAKNALLWSSMCVHSLFVGQYNSKTLKIYSKQHKKIKKKIICLTKQNHYKTSHFNYY